MQKIFRSMAYGAVAVILSVVQASAVTYTYTGNPDPTRFNKSITAIVNLNCVGPCAAGDYIEGAGLISFSLTSFANLILSTASTDTGYTNDGYINYLVLNGSGDVTRWLLIARNNTQAGQPLLYTLGNDSGPPSNCNCGTQDYAEFTNPSTVYLFVVNNPGVWTAESVSSAPVPATLPLFAGGLGVVGFFARRKRRNRSGAVAV
jgi:PEP-CTERM motif